MHLTGFQMLLVAAIIVILLLIFMTKKEKYADFATLNNISAKNTMVFPPATSVISPNMYQPNYTKKIMYGGKVLACPPGTTNVGDKCLTSKFGPLINGKCPKTMLPNTSIDPNMKCVARFTPRKLIDGVMRCYESEIDTEDLNCAVGNDSVFTLREFINGKWVCPTGTKDTGFSEVGINGTRQCERLP